MDNGWGLRIARWIFGAFYVFAATMKIIHSGAPLPFRNPGAEALNSAAHAALFIDPLIVVALVVGGLLLLFHRTAPLGLAILAPMVLVFSLFQAVLNEAWWVGAVTLAYLLFLAFAYRQAFMPLWNYRGPSSGGPPRTPPHRGVA